MARPETPKLTVDIIIEMVDLEHRPIILIERRNPPLGWALPGGFVDIGETLEQAAIREAREETCVDAKLKTLLGCYSDPQRDPRSHTVSAVYIAEAHGQPQAADDAANLQLFTTVDLPQTLCFDHDLIMADYLEYLKSGHTCPVRG